MLRFRQSPLPALFRFHCAGGARVASRNAIVGICVIIIVIGSAPDWLLLVRAIARGLTARGVAPTALIVLTILAFAQAVDAMPRLTLGLGGWARSLPVSGAAHRRGITLGLAVVQIPLAAAVLLSALAVVTVHGDSLSWPKLLGVPVALLAAGAAAVPSRRMVIASPLASGAALLAASGSWLALALSLALFAVADHVAGDFRFPARRAAVPVPAAPGTVRMFRFTWRAVGWRALTPLPLAALALAAAWFYTRNNELTGADLGFVARLWGVVGVTLYVGALADLIAARRPAWPWARSLAWSSRHRVIDDALALAIPAVPVALAAAVVDVRALLVTLPLLGPIALLGAASLPRARHHVTRASGRLMLIGVPLATLTAFAPWIAAIPVLLVPSLIRFAARVDRRSTVTGWKELYHDAAGDSLAWSAR